MHYLSYVHNFISASIKTPEKTLIQKPLGGLSIESKIKIN